MNNKTVSNLGFIGISLLLFTLIFGGQYRDNWDLAAARASSVVQSISKSGDIPLDRLMAISYGESKPLASNNDAAGRSKNRRIEIEIKY